MNAPLTFDDTRIAFLHRSDAELRRIHLLFRLMNDPFLVKTGSQLFLWAMRFRLPVHFLFRPTLYRHFCGGETLEACVPLIQRLSGNGLGASLDYAVEEKSAEEEFDRVKEETLSSIRFARRHPSVKSISIKPTSLAAGNLLRHGGEGEQLPPEGRKEYAALKNRLKAICTGAASSPLQIYIDAEQSGILRATDRLSEDLMNRFNRSGPRVFITLQMYRRDRLNFLEQLMADASASGYILAVKLVRGAYWQQEVDLARREGREPGVFLRKEETDAAYDRALEICTGHISRVALCAATHNEASARRLAALMEKQGITKDHPHILFAQLYGMSDHISYTLAQKGYNVIKYIPYGPVKQTIPYLIRRAQENTSVSDQMGRELQLIVKEIERRRAGREKH